MAGIPMGPSCNSLLWHWVRIIFFVGCAAVSIGLTQSGCGSSRSDAPPVKVEETPAKPATAAPAPAVVTDTRPAIVAFGDSLTAGFGAEPGSSYPDFLQKDLDRAGLRWRVVNAGVSGDTTTDGANRVSEVLAVKPRVVILEFGGNDGLRGLPIETTRANLDQMIVALRNSGATVILAGMTLPPNYGPDYIQGFERVYQDLAVKYKLVRIPFLLQGVATDRSLMQRDGIHPTGQGNEKVAVTVMKYVRPVLSGR
jgi:acyl-CoA thioesterase I